jgi:hypothetical protein
MLPSVPTTDQLFHQLGLYHVNNKDADVVFVSRGGKDGCLQVTLDTSQYRPDELKVSIEVTTDVVIEGRHVEEGKMAAQFMRR